MDIWDFLGRNEQREPNPVDIPWNPGWLIGILISWLIIVIPTQLGTISSLIYSDKNQGPFGHCSNVVVLKFQLEEWTFLKSIPYHHSGSISVTGDIITFTQNYVSWNAENTGSWWLLFPYTCKVRNKLGQTQTDNDFSCPFFCLSIALRLGRKVGTDPKRWPGRTTTLSLVSFCWRNFKTPQTKSPQ